MLFLADYFSFLVYHFSLLADYFLFLVYHLGKQTATVFCTDSSTNKQLDDKHCDIANKLTPTSKVCNEGLCEKFLWRAVDGVCSVTCGDGE